MWYRAAAQSWTISAQRTATERDFAPSSWPSTSNSVLSMPRFSAVSIFFFLARVVCQWAYALILYHGDHLGTDSSALETVAWWPKRIGPVQLHLLLRVVLDLRRLKRRSDSMAKASKVSGTQLARNASGQSPRATIKAPGVWSLSMISPNRKHWTTLRSGSKTSATSAPKM